MTSIGREPNHSKNAFDVLRVIAAWAVLYSHSYALWGLPEPEPVAGQTYGSLAVALFFSVSGFLVCQSWCRDPSFWRFTVRRALRILPALFLAVTFTALIIGPIFTSMPLAKYFQGTEVWFYILKAGAMLGEPRLPGLFENNVYPFANNGSLWTLRYEVIMYISLAVFSFCVSSMWLQFKQPYLFALIFCAALWVFLGALRLIPYQILFESGIGVDLFVDRIFYLGVFFFCGCLLYVNFSKLPLSIPLALVLLAPCFFVSSKSLAVVLLWIAVPYAGIVFAFRAPAIFRKLGGADYSYGIYIFAFPIQQSISQVFTGTGIGWAGFLVLSTVITVLFAALSWHWIERPALAYKRYLI